MLMKQTQECVSGQCDPNPQAENQSTASCPCQRPAVIPDPTQLAESVLADSFVARLITRKAHSLSRRRGFTESDIEDIEQELRLAIFQACSRFSNHRGVVKSFAATVINRAIAGLIRHRETAMRSPTSEAGSLNQMVEGSEGQIQWIDMFDVNDHARRTGGQRRGDSEQVALSQDLQTALEGLPPETREICVLLTHCTKAEIESELGMTRGKVRTHIAIIREHFESLGIRDYL